MGAWGTSGFENDDAMDWLEELQNSQDEAALVRAFRAALVGDDYLEVDVGHVVVAAAEVVAALLGSPKEGLPDEIITWVEERHLVPGADLMQWAKDAVTRVVDSENSEVAQLWEESNDAEEWRQSIDDLMRRLGNTHSTI